MRFENKWTAATYGTLGAKYDIASILPLFRFKYDPTVPQTFPPNNSWSLANWFIAESGISDPNCGVTTQQGLSAREAQTLQTAASAPNTATAWDERRDLLQKLLAEPGISTSNAAAAAYLNQQSQVNTTAWRFAKALRQWAAVSVLPEDIAATLSEFDTQLAELNNESATAGAQAASEQQMELAAQRLEWYNSTVWPLHQEKLQLLLATVADLPASQVYEANLKQILHIGVRHVLGDSLAGTDLEVLRTIATQCPATGGWWVRMAPLWLPEAERAVYWSRDIDKECGVEGRSRPAIQLEGIKMVPNPAKDQADIYLPAAVTGIWQLYDLTGRAVMSGQVLEGKNISLNLAQQKPGLYFFQLTDEKGGVQTAKLTIQE